jgi:hypothetical protein
LEATSITTHMLIGSFFIATPPRVKRAHESVVCGDISNWTLSVEWLAGENGPSGLAAWP